MYKRKYELEAIFFLRTLLNLGVHVAGVVLAHFNYLVIYSFAPCLLLILLPHTSVKFTYVHSSNSFWG